MKGNFPQVRKYTLIHALLPANKLELASLYLRIGLAFVYLYAALMMSAQPQEYLKFVPQFVNPFIPPETFLHLFSIIEIILSLWLLLGRKTFFAALTSTVLIFSLTLFNFEYFNVLFRNVSIFFASLALAALHSKEENSLYPYF